MRLPRRTYRLTPTPPTSARPGTPNARAPAGPTTDAHFVGTLRSPRSAIGINDPIAPSGVSGWRMRIAIGRPFGRPR